MALSDIMEPFQWGQGGRRMSADEIARQRRVEDALLARGVDTSPVGHWTQGLARVADALAGSIRRGRLDDAAAANAKADSEYMQEIAAALGPQQFPAAPGASGGDGSTYTTNAPGAGTTVSGGGTPDMSGNQIYSEFMDAVKSGGISNPNALAAIAATGKAESGFSPGNVFRTWSDPSESGAAGNAGGIMSWRGPRLQAMQQFAAANGGDPNRPSPALQAQFLLQEDPDLIASLNNAQSPAEAQQLMNNAWKFAGYNRPGGEAARRIASANSFAPQFTGGSSNAVDAVNAFAEGQPTRVASLDPSVGMANGLVRRPGMADIPNAVAPIPNSPSSLASVDPASLVTPVAASPVPMQFGPFAAGDAQSALVDRMTSPQSLTGGAPMPMQEMVADAAPPLPAPRTMQDMPVTGTPAPPPSVVQALVGSGQWGRMDPNNPATIPIMAGGTAGAYQPGQFTGISPAVIKALSDPYVSDNVRGVAGILLKQQLETQQKQQAAEAAIAQRQSAARAAGIDPAMAGDPELWKAATAAQFRDPATATVGNVVVDTRTGKPIYTGEREQPTSVQEYEFYRQQAGPNALPYDQWDQARRHAAANNVNVNAGGKAWDQESAKLFAKRYNDITDAAGNAQTMLGMYDLAEQALTSGVRTGFGAETELNLRQLGAAMGLDTDPDKLAGGELIRSVQNRMALLMRSPDGGMGMPGALSDRDIKFLKDSQIGLDRSPEGNRKMLTAYRAMEKRKIQLSALADQYVEEHGQLDAGFNKTVREYADANPLFPDQPNNAAGTTSGGLKWSIEP